MSVVQPQWGLETTANGVFQLSRELMIACTSDNVQPLAILACQQFGSTLAMCLETCRKIEKLVLPTPEPVAIRFLKAKVKFSKNDCATQIGTNSAGIRFLALIAALLDALDTRQAAKAVYLMLQDSASDLTLSPTYTHTLAVLTSLEARCFRSGFGNEVFGYLLFIRNSIPRSELDGLSGIPEEALDSVPAANSINCLIEAFRQLSRLGSSSIIGVTIMTDGAVSWIAAFTKWCLGTPPTIYWGDVEEPILSQPKSHVTVQVTPGFHEDCRLSVRLNHKVASPTDLIVPPGDCFIPASSNRRMVNVQSYGQWLLHDLGLNRLQDTAMLIEDILGILPHVPTFINAPSLLSGMPARVDGSNTTWDACFYSPFPSLSHIEIVCAHLFNLPQPPDLRGTSHESMPKPGATLTKYFDGLRKRCEGHLCADGGGLCPSDEFIYKLARTISIVLTISLFYLSPSVLLSFPPRRHAPTMAGIVAKILIEWFGTSLEKAHPKLHYIQNREPHLGLFRAVYEHALALIGCDTLLVRDLEKKETLFSACGQVCFLLIYEAKNLPIDGYLSIISQPGTMRFDREIIHKVVAGQPHYKISQEYGLTQLSPSIKNQPVTSLANHFTKTSPFWKVQFVDEGILSTTLSAISSDGRISQCSILPFFGIRTLSEAVCLKTCPHHPRNAVSDADPKVVYDGIAFKDQPRMQNSQDELRVVPIAGSHELRLFTLAFANLKPKTRLLLPFFDSSLSALLEPQGGQLKATTAFPRVDVVLRESACLACCIRFSRDVKAKLLIL